MDAAWSRRKVEILLYGFSERFNEILGEAAGARIVDSCDGLTAYELRCRAYDHGAIEGVLEAIQLENAAVNGIHRDRMARNAILLAARTGSHPYYIGEFLCGDGAVGKKLIDKGIAMISLYERSRAKHVCAPGDWSGRVLGDVACYRCMESIVEYAGDLCHDCHSKLRKRPGRPLGTFKKHKQPGDMTLQELVDTQDDDKHLADSDVWQKRTATLYDSDIDREALKRWTEADEH